MDFGWSSASALHWGRKLVAALTAEVPQGLKPALDGWLKCRPEGLLHPNEAGGMAEGRAPSKHGIRLAARLNRLRENMEFGWQHG